MRSSLQRALVLLGVGAAATLLAAGCGSSHNGGSGTDGGTDGASSGGSSSGGSSSGEGSDAGDGAANSSSSSSSSGGGDAGDAGCVFQTLVTGIVTNPPSAPVPCDTALCGCTDDGMLINKVQGSF
jgi:hypothetical protein